VRINHKHICRYHQDLYYEEDEDSEFETLAIPSDEETRHLNEVPINTGSKKGKESTVMTQKPKIPPKPRLTPSMDLSQLNNVEEQSRKKTTLAKKEITASLPAVKNNEMKSIIPRSTSLQPHSRLLNSSNTMNLSPSASAELQSYVSADSNSSLLNNVYQPPNLSNLKYGEESLSPSPEVIKKDITENLPSPVIANTGSHSSGSVKEDGEIFRSLSIDSVEQDEVELDDDGDDDVIVEKSQGGIVDIPVGDEETAKGENYCAEMYVKVLKICLCFLWIEEAVS